MSLQQLRGTVMNGGTGAQPQFDLKKKKKDGGEGGQQAHTGNQVGVE